MGLSEGNIFAGEFLAPQMYSFRPAPGYADYRTPITGYYQCGSGTHPGGCVMGAPGKLAAARIIGDRETGRTPTNRRRSALDPRGIGGRSNRRRITLFGTRVVPDDRRRAGWNSARSG